MEPKNGADKLPAEERPADKLPADELPAEESTSGEGAAEPEREPRPAAAIRQSPRLGRRLDTWGFVAMVLGAAVYGSDVGLGEGSGSSWVDVVVQLAGLGLVVFGLWAVLRGRRHLHRILPDLRAVPADEPVVLFLRTFSDDPGFAKTVAARPGRWLMWPPPIAPADFRTEEAQIARGVAPFGRMVALGDPADRLPQTGAERSYASTETWRAEVLAAFDRANLVLLSAGSGQSLRWEVEQAVGRDDPARLVVVVPRTKGKYADFRAAMGNLFPKGLPEAPQDRASRVRHVRAVIWFEPDWTPHLELLTGRLPLFRSAARTQYGLPRALRPVYERAGLMAPAKDASTVPRPRSVPAAVALFCVSVWAVPLLFFLVTPLVAEGRPAPESSGLLNTGNVVGDWFVGLGLAVLFALPFAAWMRRVLRGGPIAVLMLLIWCVVPAVLLMAWAFMVAMFAIPALAAKSVLGVAATLFGAVNILLAGVAVPITLCLLLFRRPVRDWIESRT